jgi:hypothetical protein
MKTQTLTLVFLLAVTGCATTRTRPLSGCEKLALAEQHALAHMGTESYVVFIQYRMHATNHAVLWVVQPDGKFMTYDPALMRYLARDEYRIKGFETADYSFYGRAQ